MRHVVIGLSIAFLMLRGASLVGQDTTPCGAECMQVAADAVKACRDGGGNFLDCAKVFMEALQDCRAKAGCDDPTPPKFCGEECLATAGDAAKACHEAGGTLLECAKAFMDAMKDCLATAGCEIPKPPAICGEECLTAARDAAKACHEAGGDEAACFLEVKNQLKTCLEAAGCDVPSPPPVPEPPCGMSCLKDALTAAKDCLQGGGDLQTCATTFRDTLEACRVTAGCTSGEPPPPGESDAAVLPLLLEKTFLRGDVNGDTIVDISDPIGVLYFLFMGNSPPACLDQADASDDGVVDIGDPILLLDSIFLGTASVPPPFPAEGFDPTEDSSICGMQ